MRIIVKFSKENSKAVVNYLDLGDSRGYTN